MERALQSLAVSMDLDHIAWFDLDSSSLSRIVVGYWSAVSMNNIP